MAELPTGIVTFLFTDIEGSTAKWERDRGAMSIDLALHDRLLRAAVEENNGRVVNTAGDGYAVVFNVAADAIAAALDAQRSLSTADWKGERLLVRMGIHTGPADERDEDYFGPAVNRAARVMAAAAGGQILVSHVTEELVETLPEGLSLRPLGEIWLRGVDRPIGVAQLVAPGISSEFPPLQSAGESGFLPLDLSSFVGREAELQDIGQRLDESRLVTLVGVGGVGKTTLAKRAAAARADAFVDGVWFVALAPISDADLISTTVARTLGLQQRLDRSLREVVLDHLKARTLLLVFDNCEHLLHAAAEFTTRVLATASNVKVLATSRERLGVPGEAVWMVPPLGVAGEDSDASRLFVERARAIRPGFEVDSADQRAISLICAHVDGIPLAIELAAARLAVLTVEQIEARLDNMIRLLADRARTGDPRQQTLSAALDWSYQLLEEPARKRFRSMSVFRGGFTLDAAESLFGGSDSGDGYVVDAVARLVEASLLTFDPTSGRYRLLEPVRQFALALLVGSGEQLEISRRHARHYAQVLAGALRRFRGARLESWVATYDLERDNARAAILWALENDANLALSLVSEMAVYWLDTGAHEEARQHLAMVLGSDDTVPSRELALAYAVSSELASLDGDQQAEADAALRALTIADEVGDPIAQAHARLRQAHTIWDGGSAGPAVDLFRDAIDRLHAVDSPTSTRALWEFGLLLYYMGRIDDGNRVLVELEQAALRYRQPDAAGLVDELRGVGAAYEGSEGSDEHVRRSIDVRRSFGRKADLVNILRRQVWSALEVGDSERARRSGEEAAALAREIGNRPGEAAALIVLSRVPLAEDDWDGAADYLHRGLCLLGGWRNNDWYMFGMFHCARLAAGRGEFRTSVSLYAVSARIRRDVPMALVFSMIAEEQDDLIEARTHLGDAAYDDAWREGSTAELAAARELAVALTQPATA